ncbi:MAG: hypothetical protein HDS18_04095 [Bacteroides sp.]|nr:hypothetical protein [Bacteroides sp.]
MPINFKEFYYICSWIALIAEIAGIAIIAKIAIMAKIATIAKVAIKAIIANIGYLEANLIINLLKI